MNIDMSVVDDKLHSYSVIVLLTQQESHLRSILWPIQTDTLIMTSYVNNSTDGSMLARSYFQIDPSDNMY